MQFTFLDMAGKTLFVRDDAERAQWTQEELSLDIEFPRIEDKIVSIGQRILFRDPSTNEPQIFEVKQAKTLEPDHYQAVTAEHICISELSDDHIDNAEITDKTASNALATVLAGTQWNVGTVESNPTSSMDVNRGSVWQAVLQIKTNWNVYIEPRVTISANGTISRYLDILSTAGKWNGVRLSIDKNFLSPSVTYDDSEVITAMYGYGGTTTPTKQGEQETEITFADVVWSKTSTHPAKPAGQKYIEDPAATAAYGRNGRKRFGFYQNTDITDPETLLEKTWEALQAASKPAISIDGTVADLYRMGYADQPIKLHDVALVEVNPAGFKSQIQIIRMITDLIDPSQTSVTIGAYIPNIIYIERNTYETTTGSRGGGGNKSKQTVRSEYETAILKNNREIQLRAYQNDLDDLDNEVKEQEARITVEHNRITQEVTDRREADTTLNTVFSAKITVEANRITQEVTERKADTATLSSRITQTANDITLEVNRAKGVENTLSGRITVNADKVGLVVEERGGTNVIKAASIVASVNDAGSTVAIDADHVNITGNVKLSGCMDIQDGSLRVTRALLVSGSTSNVTINNGTINSKAYQVNSGGGIKFVGAGTGEYYDLDAGTLQGMVKSFAVAGNVLTLTPFYGDPVNFSKATTLTGSWSGGVYTVTASPQGNTKTVGFSQSADSSISLATNGTPTSVSTNRKLVEAPIRVIETQGTTQSDVYTTNLTINATEAWNYGYDNARGNVTMPGAGTAETFNVLVPNAARTGQDTKTFTITKGEPSSSGGYAAVSLSGTVVGRIDISDWWNAGYAVTTGQITHSGFSINYTQSVSGRTQLGSFSKAALSGNSYIIFQIAVHGTTKRYYITVNN